MIRSDAPLQVDELQRDAQYYKDSVEILGLGLTELESFINPNNTRAVSFKRQVSRQKQYTTQSSKEELKSMILERLDRVDYMLEQKCVSWTEMQREIEEVQDACTAIIQEFMKWFNTQT